MEDEAAAFGLILVTLPVMKKTLNIIAVIFIVVASVIIAGYYWKNEVPETTYAATDSSNDYVAATNQDSVKSVDIKKSITADNVPPSSQISTANIPVDSIVQFAETLIGTPYLYASTDPLKGFDCSGFITHVFNHFKINVPRSSIDFTNVGMEIPLADSRKGDLILFTGTDSLERFVGHMGIIIKNENNLVEFIHSSSGKANGVVITPLNSYYMGRFVKVVRI